MQDSRLEDITEDEMARSRNIKPSFFLNEDLGELSPEARLLFAGLWCLADREGRLEDRPKRIKIEVLPYDDCDVDDLLQALYEKGMILRYEVDGHRYVQVQNFKKHQSPHMKEAASTIPAPCKNREATNKGSSEPDKSRPDSLNLIPDSLNLAAVEAQNELGDHTGSEECAAALDQITETLKLFAENTSPSNITPVAQEAIQHWCEDAGCELVQACIRDVASKNGKKPWGYMEKRLIEWYELGLRTQADVDAYLDQTKSPRAAPSIPAYEPDEMDFDAVMERVGVTG